MKRSLPAYVYRKRARGREYLYFIRTKGAKAARIQSAPGTAEFAAEYARLLRGDVPLPEPTQRTFSRLIASYRRSERFRRLAPRSQADYEKVLRWAEDKLGHLPPARMQRKDVIRARDANRDAVRFANYVVQVLRVLFEHAIDEGWREDNPAKGVQAIKGASIDRQPWPREKVTAAREKARAGSLERTILEILLGTGQRIGDALKMRWSDLEDGGIRVRQGKTGAALWIPLSRDLQAALKATPRRGLTIIADDAGRPVDYYKAARVMRGLREAIGAQAYDLHALRYTAASELAALGCDDETIMAITGHTTTAMVRRYAGAARQKARATDAITRRDKASATPRKEKK